MQCFSDTPIKLLTIKYQIESVNLKAKGPRDDGHDDVDEVDEGGDDPHRVLLVLAVVDGERDGQGQDGDDDGDHLTFLVTFRVQNQDVLHGVSLELVEQEVELEIKKTC
jgi:hypothetical protein